MSEQEKLEDLLVTLSALFLDYFEIHPNNLDFSDVPEVLSKGEIYEFGNLMIDVHEYYGVEVDYEAETEFDLFPTIKSVCEYFMEKI